MVFMPAVPLEFFSNGECKNTDYHTTDDPGRRSQKQPARYPIDGTRNRAKSINAHQRDDVLGGKPSDGAAHFKRNRRKRSPLSTGMSADFQSVSAPDADGISAVETDSRSGRQSRNTNEFCPCRFWEQMV